MFEIADIPRKTKPISGLLDWQQELKNNITNIDQLKSYLRLSESEEADLRKVVGEHPMNIPPVSLSAS